MTPSPVLGARTAYPLAVVAGILYYLAFPGVGLWPLAFVALAPLFVALEGQPLRRAFALGLTAGFAMNVGGFYWLFGMLKTFSGFPWPLCAIFAGLLSIYQGSRIGLLGLLHARAASNGWPRSLTLMLAFVVSELVWPLLFPWYFGVSLLPAPALTQVADLGGPYLIGCVLVAPSLGLAELVLARRAGRRPHRGPLAVALAIPLVALAYGAVRIRQVDARAMAAPSVNVGLVQGNMSLTPMPGERKESLRQHLKATRTLRDRGAELVVWSEATVMFGIPEASYGAFLENLFTRNLGVPTIFGAVLHARGDVGRAYNTALASEANGHVTSRYDKQYLLAFGEYLPFGDTFPILYDWSPNSGRLTPGTSVAPLTLGDHRLTALVCYEDILPSFVNAAVREGDPDMLVNLTNDAWFGPTTEAWEHLALAQLRSIEHRKYLLRATNTGISGVVDPVGRLIAHGGSFVADTVQTTAHWMRGGRTGYEVWGDGPWWLSSVVLLTMCLRRRKPGPLAA